MKRATHGRIFVLPRVAVCAGILALGAELSSVRPAHAPPPVRTLEDIYGPSGDSFQAALGFRVFEGDNQVAPTTSYGVGVDDMRIAWREYKLVEDATDCATSGACASVVIDAGRAYGGNGILHVTVLDSSPYGAAAPFDRNDCNRNGSYLDAADDTDCDDDGAPDVPLVVTAGPEPLGEPLVANRTAIGTYEARLPYSATSDAPGLLRIEDAGASGAEATVRYEDRWDGTASGNRCRNSANPAQQGFVFGTVDIGLVTGSVTVVSYRLVDVTGDLDGFPDTNETFDLYLTIANKTNAYLTDVVVEASTHDPKIDCIVSALALIPSMTPKGTPGALQETPTPIRLHVAAAADRGGTTPAASCVAQQCSNGAGSCVHAADCQKTMVDLYAARIEVGISANSFDTSAAPQRVDLDLDLNSAAAAQPTFTSVEGFEAGLGNFTFQNLDANRASNSASNGFRCQYNDPDYPSGGSYGSNTECYLGFQAGQSPVNAWHAHTTAAPDGGRAYVGAASLHYGIHTPGNPGLDTYQLSQLDAVRSKVALQLAPRVCANDPAADKRACATDADCVTFGGGPCASASPRLSFKHQISLTDSRGTNTPTGEAADRAVLHAQVVGAPLWQKLHPYENTYDVVGTDAFSNCLFDPTDDGNDEDDFFDPTNPARRFGPSSTCKPEFVFAYLGDTDAPFQPNEIGGAGDGPGLAGSLGMGTWVESKFDLSRYRGRSVLLRFVVTTIKVSDTMTLQELFLWNPVPYDDGWYVDDVRVTQVLASGSPTTAIDAANNAGLAACPAPACSTLVPSLTFSPAGSSAPGARVELRAGGTTADACVNGVLLYRFFVDRDASGTFSAGDTVVRDFTAGSSVVEAPSTTTRYGVTVRCSAGGSGGCSGADATATFPISCAPPPPVFDPELWWARVGWTNDNTLSGPPYGEVVDVIRGSLDLLRSTGSFAASGAACLANDAGFPPLADTTPLPAGSGFYYVLRGQVNCNDTRSYSTYSPRENPANPGKRDAELTACPP